MRRREAIGLLTGAPLLAQQSRPLTPVDGGACVPAAGDYGFLWWANGWGLRGPASPQLLCIQTGLYGLAIDVQQMRLPHFGPIQNALPYSQAVAQDQRVISSLPPGQLSIELKVGTRLYRCVRAAVNQKDFMNFPVRMIEAGRLLQRADILQLEFADEAEPSPKVEARLEIVAWPDRIAFLVELTPAEDLENARLRVVVGDSAGEYESASWKAGEVHSAFCVQSFAGAELSVEIRTAAPISHDAARGWTRIELPNERWDPAADLDHLERLPLAISNPTDKPQIARLLFAKDYSFQGVTGMTPMLRDSDGTPNGIHVQLSKNWHRQPDRRMLYEGPWFHGFAVVRVPPRSIWTGEFSVTYGRWGGVPAASHAQLSLVGWGGNQLWHEAAIGSWGESICYEPDGVQKRCLIDDVRPLMVWAMSDPPKRKWNWTNNVGGGDFLVYYNERNEYQRLGHMRVAYDRHGPNLTGCTFAGVTADGKIAARIHVAIPRCDDIMRSYHQFRYDVREKTAFRRLAFYQVGSDNYNWHQFNLMARGNAAGLLEEWKPERGGAVYERTGMPCPGSAPWFSLHDAIPADHLKPVKGAWASRGLIIRSWRARLGGRDVPAHASVFRTQAGKIPSANLELSAPPDLSELLPGDFVEALVELVILPLSADDYYGPNEGLRASLAGAGNTWKPVHRQAAGNLLDIRVIQGAIVQDYPPVVMVDEDQSAELEIAGGIGYVPVTFSELLDYKGYELLVTGNGKTSRLNQSVHGNDFWQATHDPSERTWSLTYNVPLDTPGDARRSVRLTLRRR